MEAGDAPKTATDAKGPQKPEKKQQGRRFGRLLSLVDSLPDVPLTGGDLPDDDKRLLGERHL